MNFCINVYGYLPRAAAAPMQKPNISRRQSQLDEDSDSDVYLDLDVDVLVAILSSCENGGEPMTRSTLQIVVRLAFVINEASSRWKELGVV